MNVLFVSELSNLGGGETSLLNLMREFKLNNKEVNPILLCFEEGKLTKESREKNIKTIIYNINSNIKSGHVFNTIKNIKKIIIKENIQVVQTNEWKTAVIISFVNKIIFKRCKVIWVCHGQWYKFNFVKRNLINIFINNIIAVSKNVENNLIKNNINFNKISHIPLGIDIENFKYGDKNKVRIENNISQDEIVFGVIGRFQEIKGQKLVIEAVKILKENNKKCKILFIGDSIFNNINDDIYKKECLNLIRQHNLEEYFKFLGVRRDINDILKGIDALIVPSINESFGMVIIEAFASNCIVIATPCDGPKEIISNRYDGFILDNRSDDLLAKSLEEIIDDKKSFEFIKKNQSKSLMKYSIKKICNQYNSLYRF